MSALPARAYRFANAAQWAACLVVGTAAGETVAPVPPLSRTPERIGAPGASALATMPGGVVAWHDARRELQFRWTAGEDAPERAAGPAALARAKRVVSTGFGLWALGATLQRFEAETLARLARIDLSGDHLVDIAADGRGTVYALAERGGRWFALQVDCAGRVHARLPLDGIAHATAFVFLRTRKRFVVLGDGDDPRLSGFAITGGPALFSRSVAAIHHCFHATALGGDGRDRACLAGVDADGRAHVACFDGDGTPGERVTLDAKDAPVASVVASRSGLFVAGARGVLRFATADRVPEGVDATRCTVLTPALRAPEREDGRRWLRIEADVRLPHGATLEVSFAATEEAAVRDRIAALAADPATPPDARVDAILRDRALTWHPPFTFHGDTDGATPIRIAAPLHGERSPHLWVCARLIAGPGARLPTLDALAVAYPGSTLMQHLPAIYQREEFEPQGFLRALIGVLETTTQDLDARIAAIGSHVHPMQASETWLNTLARWLDLPWDDTLAPGQKRCIVAHAHALATTRGTRAGLDTFLACLMPDQPRRFRVVDATADAGFAIVAGGACGGSTLPAMLAGRPRGQGALDEDAVLDCLRLPCPGAREDPAAHLAGRIRIDIAATQRERAAWSPWLQRTIDRLVPMTTRARVHWVVALHDAVLDGGLVLEGRRTAHLGADAVTDASWLPERGTRIDATGPATGTRLL